MIAWPDVGLRTCTVSYCDLKGIQHAVEVTADPLYEAVAQGLRVFRENDWIDKVIFILANDEIVRVYERILQRTRTSSGSH